MQELVLVLVRSVPDPFGLYAFGTPNVCEVLSRKENRRIQRGLRQGILQGESTSKRYCIKCKKMLDI